MPEKIQGAKVVCQGGLDSSQNYLALSETAPGAATRLINYEPSLFGGYRRIDGYQPLIEAHPIVGQGIAEGPVLCVAFFRDEIIAARKDIGTNTYTFYSSSSASGWIAQATGLDFSSLGVSRVRWATYNFDGTEKIMFVDGVNPPVIFDGASWEQVTPEATGGSETNAGGDQLVPRPKYITVFQNHIFVSGDPTAPNVIAHSAPLKDWDWKAASGGGQLTAGYEVNQIKPFRETLFVFGQNDIKKVNVNNTTFVINDVVSNTGCVSSDSVVEINGDLLFMAPDGVRPISATDRIGDIEFASVSKKIHQVLKELIANHTVTEVTAVAVRSKSQVRFFFNEATDPKGTTEGIIGGIRDDAAGPQWEWGELRGIKAHVVSSGYMGRKEFIVHGDYDGRVHRQETGNTFDGDEIHHLYVTPFLDFGDTTVRKTLRKISVFLRPEGTNELATSVSNDWGSQFTINPRGYVEITQGSSAYYGQVRYGSGAQYGGATFPVIFNNLQSSAFSTQFTFSTLGIGPSHTIHGFVVEFSADGKI